METIKMEANCCEVVRDPSIANKEQAILSELREIKMKLLKVRSNISGNEPVEEGNPTEPSNLMENVEMNMRLVSDISVIASSIGELLF